MKFYIFIGLFCSVMADDSGRVVNVNGKDFGNFDVLDVKINKDETDSKKIVTVKIDNLNLTVDTMRGGVWVYLKSLSNNQNYNSIPRIQVSASEKVHTLDSKTLSPFDTLVITLPLDVTSLDSKKKINVFINDMVVVLDTRNWVSLSMKNSKDIFNNNNSVFYSYNDGNNIDVEYHWDGAGVSYSFSGGSGHFDKEAFDKGMKQLEDSMKKMQDNMQNSFPWNWSWN